MEKSFYELWFKGKTSLAETEALAAELTKIKREDLLEQTIWAPNDEVRYFLIDKVVKTKVDLKNGMNDFHAAAISGRMEDFERAKKRGADPDQMMTQSKRGVLCKPIHLAAWTNHCEIIEAFLNEGVPVDTQGDSDKTPLMVALEQGANEAAQLLIEKGADVNKKGGFQKTSSLFYLCDKITIKTIDMLLDKGATLDTKTGSGDNLGFALIRNKAFNALYYLLEKGLSPVFDKDKGNLLFEALDFLYSEYAYKEENRETYFKLLDFLIELPEIDLNTTYHFNDYPNEEFPRKTTALDVALEYSGPEVVKFLLEKGAKLPKKFNPQPFLNTGEWILEKADLLKEAGMPIEQGMLIPRVLRGMIEDYDNEHERMIAFFPSLLLEPRFKDIRDDRGLDMLFLYLLKKTEAYKYQGPVFEKEMVQQFLEAGCPVDISYQAENIQEISEINYKLRNILKRSSYTSLDLVKDLISATSDKNNAKQMQEILDMMESNTGKKGVDANTGKGVGFDFEACLTLSYSVAVENIPYDQIVKLNRFLAAKPADLIPVADLSQFESCEGYDYTCLIGIAVKITDSYMSPDLIQPEAIENAKQAYSKLEASLWKEIGELAGVKINPNNPKFHLAGSGPGGLGYLVDGVKGVEADNDKEGDFYIGVNFEQEPHFEGVWGTKIAYADVYEWAVEVSEEQLSSAKHSLYLMASYGG